MFEGWERLPSREHADVLPPMDDVRSFGRG